MEIFASTTMILLGLIVLFAVIIISRSLWIWLLGINEVLIELRAIRKALESRDTP